MNIVLLLGLLDPAVQQKVLQLISISDLVMIQFLLQSSAE